MGSKSSQSQRTSQETTQIDNRVGASDNAIVGQGQARIGSTEVSAGRDLTVTSIDPETIQGAFGLSGKVVDSLTELSGGAIRDAQNTVERVAGSTGGILERVSSGFGQQISDLATQKASGGLNTNLVIALAVMGLIALFIFKKKR